MTRKRCCWVLSFLMSKMPILIITTHLLIVNTMTGADRYIVLILKQYNFQDTRYNNIILLIIGLNAFPPPSPRRHDLQRSTMETLHPGQSQFLRLAERCRPTVVS
ncbi:unnamed protein product [Nezara viridula]|uniref:Uncharacterized protein n=1 Tax=Nezara viridula TaxID=85310 RepID=A0A9P0HTF9_NEZVI|nr:unnamed protein product [Nezara viridula]